MPPISIEKTQILEGVKLRLLAAMKEELTSGKVSRSDLLALLGYVTGACLALQDQRTMTAQQALEIVHVNIEAGNAKVIADLAKRNAAGNA